MNMSNNKHYPLTQDHRTRLYRLLNDLDNEQLRFVLSKHLQNSSVPNKFQRYTNAQLLQQGFLLIDNYYSTELEQTLHTLTQKQLPTDFYHHYQQQQQQQQQQQAYYYPQPPGQYNAETNYRFPPPPPASPAILQQLKKIRPNPVSSQSVNSRNSHPQQQQSSYNGSTHSFQQQQQAIHNLSSTSIPLSSIRPIVQRYQVPLLPTTSSITRPLTSSSSFSSPNSSSIISLTNTSQRLPTNPIVHKNLPFYRSIACVYERYNIFHFDSYRKQFVSHDEFILSLDACNQLALSSDYDPVLDNHKTSKCLLVRLVRFDRPPLFDGKYEDNLPVNLVIHVNGHILTNLPTPKPSSRQQNDLIRPGREIDITSYCMFNPALKNEVTITWSYRQDNTNLFIQYATAEYALHIFLVEHLTVKQLCDQIIGKLSRFYREDLVKIVTRARDNDTDLGLEVSGQRLKLTCPIDQKRLKNPVRATTCQHLQCFDLTNYIALNEKSYKWICPTCNKPALYEDLQIDSYTESILNSIQSDNINEITIDGDLKWTPIIPLNIMDEPIDSKSNIKLLSSSTDLIFIDDD